MRARTRRLNGLFRAAVILGVIAVSVAVASPALAASPESIRAYHTRITVRTDGSFRVEETIDYDFSNNQRHGLIRSIPTTLRYDDSRDRQYPIDDVEVSMDAGAVPTQRASDQGNVMVRIGDPDHTFSGRHTFSIAYTVHAALNSFPDHEELYWNAVGPEWDVPIATAQVEVSGPAEVTRIACYSGTVGSHAGCTAATHDGPSATFRQSHLDRHQPMTVVVGFPPASIAVGPPITTDRHTFATGFRVTAWTLGGTIALTLLTVGVVVAIAWRVGRDRRYVGMLPGLLPEPGEKVDSERVPLLGRPPVSVEFGPPKGIRPAQAGTLIDERADVVDVTATIVDLAVRRHLYIRHLPGGKKPDWELSKLPDGVGTLNWYEGTIVDALFAERDVARLSELKGNFGAQLLKVRQQLDADLLTQGWFVRSPAHTRLVTRAVAVALVCGSVAASLLLTFFTHVALLGVAFVIAAVVLLAIAGKMPARTAKGSAVLARLEGFRLYIDKVETQRIAWSEREKIFSEFLPYAMVFGLSGRWAAAFADLAVTRSEGGLYWYAGTFGGDDNGPSFSHFAAATASATSVWAISSASGSSGFSGGGSGGYSGGGAGGGGGGSW